MEKEQQNNLRQELEQLDKYIEYLEEEKIKLEKENLKRKICVENLEKQKEE